MEFAGFAAGFAIILVAIIGFTLLLSIGVWVLYSLGLYKLAKNKGINNAWLAWIPIGNDYILGSVAKDAPFIKKHIPRLDIILPIASVVLIVLSYTISFSQIFHAIQGFEPMYWRGGYNPFNFAFLANLGMIPLGLVYRAFIIFVYYHLFKLYVPNDAVLYTIISALRFEFIFIFIIRNKKPVIENVNNEPEKQKTQN